MTRIFWLVLTVPLAACGGADSARYLIETPTAVAGSETRVSSRTIELRGVSLPSHASGSEILVRDENGALRALGGAVWADNPERAVTSTLAKLLDERSTATVSTEPWPLLDGPTTRLELRIDRMLATTAGVFEISGQAAVSAIGGRPRDRVQRVSVTAPITELSAAGVTAAQGRALVALSDELIGLLR